MGASTTQDSRSEGGDSENTFPTHKTMKTKKRQIQVGTNWSNPASPIVFIDMNGIRPTNSGMNGCTIALTPQTAAQVGKEIMQLGEFCLKEFKASGRSQ
jgi:hypothetical protein